MVRPVSNQLIYRPVDSNNNEKAGFKLISRSAGYLLSCRSALISNSLKIGRLIDRPIDGIV